ncbi:MAG: hypothetical protein ACRDIA_00035, partial [Actinomycetota bacterium]
EFARVPVRRDRPARVSAGLDERGSGVIDWVRRGRVRLAALAALAASGLGALIFTLAHFLAHVLNLPHPW